MQTSKIMSTPIVPITEDPKTAGLVALLEAKFGPNWSTTVAGSIGGTLIAAVSVLSANPGLLPMLGVPENISHGIQAFCGLVGGISLALTGILAKSRNVTGGTVPSTAEAAVRVEETKQIEANQAIEDIKSSS